MKLKGTWLGKYYYDHNDAIPESVTPVSFTLIIKSNWWGRFRGTVEEDQAEGGIYGLGRVVGLQKKNEIAFVKKMPFLGIFMEDGNVQLIEELPHPNIYCEGVINPSGDEVTGTWKLKAESVLVNGEFIILSETTGSFYMRKMK